MRSSRALQVAAFVTPMLFCLALHWAGLRSWFSNDDFAWLSLRIHATEPNGWVKVLFYPEAQGTIRLWSERVFFLVFSTLFGLNALAFHIWVFLTQFASIALLVRITRRLTGSWLAATLAPILWTANAGLAVSLSWTSAYNEILCAFFVLLAFELFLLYIETGRRKFLVWQWIVFLLGFGALELNVMYPALAALYALCCARRFFLRTLPLFIPSALFAYAHLFWIPKTTDAVYALTMDARLPATLWAYVKMAFGASPLTDGYPHAAWPYHAWAATFALVLVSFAAWRAVRGNWLGVFLLGWFVLFLAPVLPLPNHITDYYLTLPAIGLSICGAWALSRTTGHGARIAAVGLLCCYMAAAGYYCFFTDHWYLERSLPLRTLVRGLRDLNAAHPGRMVLLQGIKSDLFWTGFTDGPFRLIGLNRVYLAPGSENIIEDHPAWGDATKLWTTAEAAANALNAGDAAAFDFDDGKVLRDITAPYKTVATAEYLANHRSRIDIASPVFASLLRSSPRSLTVELAGPASSNQALYVVAVSPKDSSLHLVVSADGKKLGAIALDRPGARQEFRFAMPKQFVGTYSMHVSIDADRPPIGIVASIGIK